MMTKHVVNDEDLWYEHVRDCASTTFTQVAGKVRDGSSGAVHPCMRYERYC